MVRKKLKPSTAARRTSRDRARTPSDPSALPPILVRGLYCLPVVAALIAYGDALRGPFLFDDVPAIADNQALHQGNFWKAAFHEPHSPLSNRPVACFTFVLNRWFGGLTPVGCHALNLMLHCANAFLLAAVVRRTLRTAAFAERFSERRAVALAVLCAAFWAVHPLGSEAVVYLTQRTTLLMSFFFLVVLYALLRAREAQRPAGWNGLAFAATLLGMGAKEEFVAVPILAILFERAFLYDRRSSMLARAPFYVALAGTWLLLGACVLSGPKNPTVGYRTVPQADAWQWLMTEAGVLVHYVRLTFWPTPLRAAYDWPIVRDFSQAALPGLFVGATLIVTIGLWLARPSRAWPGAMFFLLLAPTSSVLPIITEIIAERRMYLPMTALLLPTVLAAAALVDRIVAARPAVKTAVFGAACCAAVLAVVASIAATRSRAAVYGDEFAFWADAYQKNELTNKSFLSGIILSGFGKVVAEQGRAAEANELFRRALECEAPTLDTRVNYAASLVDLGRLAEAEPIYRAAIAEDDRHVNALGNLAKLLYDAHQDQASPGAANAGDPRLIEAEQLVRRALELRPNFAGYLNTSGMVLFGQGRIAEAEQAFRQSIAADPAGFHAARNLGVVWLEQGRGAETVALWLPYLQRLPADPGIPAVLAAAYRRLGNVPAAVQMLQEVLRRDPHNAAARAELTELSAGS